MNYYEEQSYHSHTANRLFNAEFCDRCGRNLKGSWIEVGGMKICWVCQWEADNYTLNKP